MEFLIPYIVGLASGVFLAFFQGSFKEFFKIREVKRKSVETFMGKVTDVIAITTKAGYTNSQNRTEKRIMDKAAFQLERLGKREMAQNINSYNAKWGIVSKMARTGARFEGNVLPAREEEKRRLELIKELDELTDKILGKKRNWFSSPF